MSYTPSICLACLLAMAPANHGQTASLPDRDARDPRPDPPLAVFEGEPDAFGRVVVFGERSRTERAAPARLDDLRLVGIAAAGSTQVERFVADRARPVDDLPGAASRLVLPEDQGSLYRYERRVGADSVFGLLHVGIDRVPRPHAELLGLGTPATGDPLLAHVAVAPDGRSVLIGTRVEAGGDLLEVDLGSGSVVDRTEHLGPLDFSSMGLWLNADWGFAVASDGVYRFPREPGALAEQVPFPVPPATFSGYAVVSNNRQWAATAAGDDADHLLPFAFSKQGPAAGVGEVPVRIEATPASLLRLGPFLAISDDGALCGWRARAATSEAFLARVEPTPGQTPAQVTDDPFFVDTVDQVGALTFRADGKLTMAVGSTDPGGTLGIEQIDVFETVLSPAGDPVLTNRTMTGQEPEPPFVPGTIDPEAIFNLPDLGGLIVLDGDSETLFGLESAGGGLTPLIADVKSIDFLVAASGRVLVGLRSAADPRPREVHRIDALDAMATLLAVDSPDSFYSGALLHDDTLLYRTAELTVDRVDRMNVLSGACESFPSGPGDHAGPIGVSLLHSALLSDGPLDGPRVHWVWRPGGVARALATPGTPGFVLPAR